MSQSNPNIITLNNGLTLVLQPISDPNQKLNITFVFNGVGFAIDGPKPGISHIAEHMVFRGTDKYTAKDIANKITSLSNSSYMAYTTYDKTVFAIDTYKNSFNEAIELLVDMFSKSTLDSFETEKQVIKHELNMRLDNPYITLYNLIDLGHGLKNNDLTHKENLPGISQNDVKNFIEKNYVPNKCQLIISGDIDDIDITEAVIKSKTKLWQNNNSQAKEWKALDYNSGYFAEKSSTNSLYCALFFKGPKSSDNIKDIVSEYIVNTVFGSRLDSSLMYNVRIKDGLTYDIETFSQINKDYGSWGIISSTDKESFPQLLQSAMKSIKATRYSIDDPKNNNVDIAKISLKNYLNQPILTASAATYDYIFHNNLGVTKDQLIKIIDETTTRDVLQWLDLTLASSPSLALYGNIDDNTYSQEVIESMWHDIVISA